MDQPREADGRRRIAAAVIASSLIAAGAGASAAPPPTDSEEMRELGPYQSWFTAQTTRMGACCSLADGRMVEARIRGGHFEVRFLHPETISAPFRPDRGTFYPVAEVAVLRGRNPTGHAIAWWSPVELFVDGASIGRIRCFIAADLY
jgi:hypothetical protein